MDKERASKLLGNKHHDRYLDLKDIVREHSLPYLPAKSLFRLSLVCKDWRNHVRTPFFSHNQSIFCSDISAFFYQSQSNPPSFVSLDPISSGVPDPSLNFLPEPVHIRTSSNGLLCCQGCVGDKPYYICNPLNRKWKKLPKPNADHGRDPAIVLIFKPSLLNFVAEFQLVCAFPSSDFDDGYEFEIYSSTKESWRISGEIYFGPKARTLAPKSGVHVNGIVYWQTKGGILKFDLKMERSQIIYGECHYGFKSEFLGVNDGKLSLTSIDQKGITVVVLSNEYTNTMQMGSDVKAWEKKCSAQFSECEFPLVLSGDRRGVVFSGDDVVVFRGGTSGKMLTYYDLKRKELKRLIEGEVDRDITILPYVNSLVEL